jgi:hypothetical protein
LLLLLLLLLVVGAAQARLLEAPALAPGRLRRAAQPTLPLLLLLQAGLPLWMGRLERWRRWAAAAAAWRRPLALPLSLPQRPQRQAAPLLVMVCAFHCDTGVCVV